MTLVDLAWVMLVPFIFCDFNDFGGIYSFLLATAFRIVGWLRRVEVVIGLLRVEVIQWLEACSVMNWWASFLFLDTTLDLIYFPRPAKSISLSADILGENPPSLPPIFLWAEALKPFLGLISKLDAEDAGLVVKGVCLLLSVSGGDLELLAWFIWNFLINFLGGYLSELFLSIDRRITGLSSFDEWTTSC